MVHELLFLFYERQRKRRRRPTQKQAKKMFFFSFFCFEKTEMELKNIEYFYDELPLPATRLATRERVIKKF